MFDTITNEILKIICDNLNLLDERKLTINYRVGNDYFRGEMVYRLTKFLAEPSANSFCQFINCIAEDEKTGFAILNDATCKEILIRKKPTELPHWLISIPESQPVLLAVCLGDKDYRDSLNASEAKYLLNNYRNLLSKQLAGTLEKELESKPIHNPDDDNMNYQDLVI